MAIQYVDYREQETARITAAMEEAKAKLVAAQEEVAALDNELAALNAYIAVKEGKSTTNITPSATKKPRAQSTGTRAPKGSRQDSILALLDQHPNGLAPIEIIEQLGAKGDDKGEASVRNALNNLYKAERISRNDGKYTAK